MVIVVVSCLDREGFIIDVWSLGGSCIGGGVLFKLLTGNASNDNPDANVVRDDGQRDQQPGGPDHTLPPRATILDAVQEAAALKGHAREQQHGDGHGHAGYHRKSFALKTRMSGASPSWLPKRLARRSTSRDTAMYAAEMDTNRTKEPSRSEALVPDSCRGLRLSLIHISEPTRPY
eukprot:TRINITY_DN29392_c0_g1_i1.p2 TRINITY_DN29392_c0_g1~~TRINITY_DN29392_c0_g1_i1.p2  ORF type:complete len:176 (-),score=23.95 TRINITY_DN29392_c0_g1_i1:49-576(-)